MNKAAFITGITGQSGSYLAELLLEDGYAVCGMVRRTATPNTQNIRDIMKNPNLTLVEGDITDGLSIRANIDSFLSAHQTTRLEIYNMAAQSHVHTSFTQPLYTTRTIVDGTIYLLEEVRRLSKSLDVRMLTASSSEMFGNAPMPATGYNETSTFAPQSPYAAAKLAAHHLVGNYRSAHGLHLSSAIFFNKESKRRGENFVTQKICKYLRNPKGKLVLGNLEAKRDWGHSEDYMRAAKLMVSAPSGCDYVIASGQTRSVREFLETAFAEKELKVEDHVEISEEFYRPNEVHCLLGDSTKIRTELGWEPKYDFEELILEMVYGW